MSDTATMLGPQGYAAAIAGTAWASPGAIGATTPNSGKFTTLQSSGACTLDTGAAGSSFGGALSLTNGTLTVNNTGGGASMVMNGASGTNAISFQIASAGTGLLESSVANPFIFRDSLNAANFANWAAGTLATGSFSFLGTLPATSAIVGSVKFTGGVAFNAANWLGLIGATFIGNTIAGVQSGAAAISGQVGEVITSTVSAAAAGANGVTANVTSISLTPGDWLLTGLSVVTGGTTGLTSGTALQLSITSTTAGTGTSGQTMSQESVLALLANGLFSQVVPGVRINISATTPYYLTQQVAYAAGSPTIAGTITATRMR